MYSRSRGTYAQEPYSTLSLSRRRTAHEGERNPKPLPTPPPLRDAHPAAITTTTPRGSRYSPAVGQAVAGWQREKDPLVRARSSDPAGCKVLLRLCTTHCGYLGVPESYLPTEVTARPVYAAGMRGDVGFCCVGDCADRDPRGAGVREVSEKSPDGSSERSWLTGPDVPCYAARRGKPGGNMGEGTWAQGVGRRAYAGGRGGGAYLGSPTRLAARVALLLTTLCAQVPCC